MLEKFFRTALCVTLFVMLFACSANSVPSPTNAEVEREERAVYLFFVGNGPGPVLILEQTSASVSDYEPGELQKLVKSNFEDVSKETLESFVSRNSNLSKLTSNMNLGLEYHLLSVDELAEISSQPNWNQILQKRYPNSSGYYIFSQVGFNNALDQAVIYVGHVAGPMMGYGSYYLMEKVNGEWRMIQEAPAWIS